MAWCEQALHSALISEKRYELVVKKLPLRTVCEVTFFCRITLRAMIFISAL